MSKKSKVETVTNLPKGKVAIYINDRKSKGAFLTLNIDPNDEWAMENSPDQRLVEIRRFLEKASAKPGQVLNREAFNVVFYPEGYDPETDATEASF